MEKNAEVKDTGKKKNKKVAFFAVLIAVVLVVTAVVGVKIYQKNKVSAAAANEITVGEGQELVYAKITSIAGNDMEVSILKEAEGKGFPFGDKSSGERPEKPSGDKSGKESGDSSGERPEMPSGDFQPGEMPSGGSPSGEKSSGDGSDSKKPERSAKQFVETGETAEFEIPVGTEVITKLGTTVTFSSLSTGDTIAIAVESGKNIIDKIWVVE